jgi:type VI secretion system secreted protein VgrG
MREAEGQGFELILDAVSTSAYLPLKSLIGEQMTVGLRQADGRYAPWHGYVTEAAQLGDGGLARYRLVMAPWLAALQLRRDSFVFQDKTVPRSWTTSLPTTPAQWRWDLASPRPCAPAPCASSTARATGPSCSACWPARA